MNPRKRKLMKLQAAQPAAPAPEPVVEVAPELEEAPEPAVEAEEAPAPRKRTSRRKKTKRED